jgi:hypothetical protein
MTSAAVLAGSRGHRGVASRCAMRVGSRSSAATVIRIAISQAAFEAISATLAHGSVSFEHASNAKGGRTVWLEPRVVDRLRALRGPGESYSDVILRIAKETAS